MQALTFAGFLGQYVRTLSHANSGGLYKLAAEAASNNPRLREPLFLYALFTSREKVLLAATKSPGLRQKYANMLTLYDKSAMELALKEVAPTLPPEYVKVYRSYLSVRDRAQHDNHTKALMRQKILRLQEEKGVSTYRLYKDLHINHGNMNAFVTHGDCSKVSLATVRTTVRYLELL